MHHQRLIFRRLGCGLALAGLVWLAVIGLATPAMAADDHLVPLRPDDRGNILPPGDLNTNCGAKGSYFLGIFPPWNRGLVDSGQDCDDISFTGQGVKREKTQTIITNVTSILLRLAGLAAVIGLIVSGFKYATSSGNPQKASGAQKSLINALSGLALAVAATLIVESIHNRLTGDVPGGVLPKAEPTVTDIIGFVMLLIGLVSLLMIVIQGMRYALSRGNPEKVAQAKNGIIYSLVGVVISVTSWSMVQFVLGKLVIPPSGQANPGDLSKLMGSIIGVIVFITGVISAIIVIIGGYNYIFSGGDSNKVSSARSTIIYALIGLIIAVAAGPILAWALGRL